ncbi:uncharacterized protein LOC131222293 isoform X4 [Magnolia sinica]|uniref:uncharacterized protein LOC131222293 isoform X4 n=1 Tax=Magnolia sinica TaxID=86752 RepID=UPI00265A5826|nr:uncharacterized protein LOC131222293 isoform X4 [Magnolia sinica]
MATPSNICFLFLLLLLLRIAFACRALEEELIVSRIAFGSCANQSAPQPIWNAIVNYDPQLFIWLGDNIYGDIRRPFKFFGKERTIGPWKNVPRFVPTSEQDMQLRYKEAKSNPGYSRLRRQAQVIGTWDDHDYGLNDAGKEFSGKNVSQRLMLDFLDEPQDSPRRKQAGVYASYMFGPERKRVKVILLDTRYHRDPLFTDGTILGDSQWTWLEKELHGPKSQITIIASSIQRDGVFFISGDVHFGEIARYDCGCQYPLYEITSSGLTQAVEKAVLPPFAFLVRVGAWLTPTTMRVFDQKCRHRSCTIGQPNFGAIEIDWDAAPVTLKLEVKDMDGVPVTSVNILLSDLQTRNVQKPTMKAGELLHHCSLEIDLPWIVRHRLAILFCGALSGLVIACLLLIYIVSISGRCLRKFKLD